MLAPVPLGWCAGSPVVPGELRRPLGLSLNPRAGVEPEGAARVRCGQMRQGRHMPSGRLATSRERHAHKIQTKQKAADKDLPPLTVALAQGTEGPSPVWKTRKCCKVTKKT